MTYFLSLDEMGKTSYYKRGQKAPTLGGGGGISQRTGLHSTHSAQIRIPTRLEKVKIHKLSNSEVCLALSMCFVWFGVSVLREGANRLKSMKQRREKRRHGG